MSHPYRFPGKPQGVFSMSEGLEHVRVIENFGGHGDVVRIWPIEDYRKAHRVAPQDLVVWRRW